MTAAAKEVTLEDFKEGLFRLAGEDQLEANSLFEEFKEAIIQEVTVSINAKKSGKLEAQVIFERMKRREARKHYKTLSRNLGSRPVNTAAHHIIPWFDKETEQARAILRRFGINIDSESNGVYLPRFKKHLPHEDMPDAYAHSEVHTKSYYLNLTAMLRIEASLPNASKEDIETVLDDIAAELADGTFPLQDKIFS